MRKIVLSITLLLVAALAISACSAATPVVPTATVGGALPTSTTAASPTGAAASSPTAAATAAATSGATSAATTASTAAATAAATAPAAAAATNTSSGVTAVATSVTNTPGAAAATSAPVAVVTSTPFAGVPGQFVRLSILLQSNMVSGAQSGQIAGVVIAQPNLANGAASGTATASPAGTQPVPYVRYVVVDMSGSATPTPGTNEVLLPWQMFAFNPSTTSANGKVSQTFSLKGSAASRQGIPQVSLPNTSGVLSQGWDTQLSQYWASQGFAIPVTGSNAQQQDTEVLLRQNVNGANIVDPKNQALGQVSDFLIDPNTGQFVYAVFNGGQLFGNRYFVVPVRNLLFQLSSATSSGLGNVQLTVPSNVLNAAPFITNPSQIPVDPALLQQLNNYWQSLQK